MKIRLGAAVLIATFAGCGGGGSGGGPVSHAGVFTVGGTVSGLTSAGLVLQLNGAGNLGIFPNGGSPMSFTLPGSLLTGTAYSVTVLDFPSGPNEACTVSNGTGTVSSGNVTDVNVVCVPGFLIGGTVSGLASGAAGTGLVLRLNGGTNVPLSDLPIGANGPFHFLMPLASGAGYAVSVSAPSPAQTCSITNGTGAVSADVTNVAVSCARGFAIDSVSGPLAAQQWHLKNTGQAAFADTGGTAGRDIDVEPAFMAGSFGTGVTVAVVDTGLEIAHEDLAANVIAGGSWNFNDNTHDPTNPGSAGDHGTSVAGLIAMARNGVGGIGVAPGASLKGFNFLLGPQSEASFLDSLGASTSNPKSDDVFIFNQSFGIDTTSDIPINPTEENQYISGVTTLRGGNGALYVKAAGNGFLGYTDGATGVPADCGSNANNTNLFAFVNGTFTGLSCENANFDPTNAIPYQIVVGAMNASGVRATYSASGSAIWVSAPGGEFGRNAALEPRLIADFYTPAMITTDQSGCTKGFSMTPPHGQSKGSAFDDGGPPNANCNYTNGFNGTSAAAPVTAGVIALMLEANPALTWRDVKDILASTATQIDATRAAVTVTLTGGSYVAEPPWTTNAANFKFHNWYGFGLVDASAAVTMARTAVLLPPLQVPAAISSGPLNIAIPDSSLTGASSILNVPTGNPVHSIEAVQISVNATHPSAGELGIELISPSGTRSVLKNIRDGFTGSADLNGMLLLSNAFYGEDASGNWTIRVVDGLAGNTGTLTGWSLQLYGH